MTEENKGFKRMDISQMKAARAKKQEEERIGKLFEENRDKVNKKIHTFLLEELGLVFLPDDHNQVTQEQHERVQKELTEQGLGVDVQVQVDGDKVAFLIRITQISIYDAVEAEVGENSE